MKTLQSPNVIGARLREARERLGLPQRTAQQHLGGMSRPTFIALEYGRREAKPQEIVSLCALYRCQVSDIVGDGAARLANTSPLQMTAALLQWVDDLDRGEVSEGRFARFCAMDRVGSRVVAEACRSMARVVRDLVVVEQKPARSSSPKGGAA